MLIVDDELMGRMVLRKIVSEFGECDMVVNGREAVEAFRMAWEENSPYDLIFLDIMMPEMDGHGALKAIRKHEEDRGIYGRKMVKVIMITAREDGASVLGSFREGCEGYAVKPVTKEKVVKVMRELGLVK
ncbi:MAG: response regulator [Candidatus Nitrospinota bacterium M3_3B_026]